jgi:DNA-binding CsgD family transcriptional regulator
VVVRADLEHAAALAAAGQWVAARDAYAAQASRDGAAQFGLARACWWLGEARRARDLAELAFAAFEAEGRYSDAAMAGVHLSVWYLSNFDNAAAARGWLSRARHLAGRGGDPVTVGWVTLVSGYLAGEQAEGRRLIETAAAAADSLSDADLACMALADLGLWHVASGDVDSGMRLLDEAMAATFASKRKMPEVVVWSSCNMLAACSLVDDLPRATQWCRAADRFMESYGCPFLQARCRAHYGRVLVAAGRYDEAEPELQQALWMSSDTGRGPRTEALTALAELRQRQGQAQVALELLAGADPTTAGVIIRSAGLLDLGNTAEARTVLRAAFALHDPVAPDAPALVSAMVDAELAAGRLHEAAEMLQPDRPVWAAPSYPRGAGLLSRAAGLVAAANGGVEEARQRLGSALDVFTELELPFEAAVSELDLARLFRESEPEAAVGCARSAHHRLQRMGARRQAAEAAALLRSLGVTPPPGPRRADALTEREREVLALLAEGLSNPDIASRLFLSPRTVGHHVSSILRKLHLHSRTEAAAYAVREGMHGSAPR